MWCRRTDELVDGPNASHTTLTTLDTWESRLEDLFAGRPFDILDAALSDTVAKFPLDIQVAITYCLSCYHLLAFSENTRTIAIIFLFLVDCINCWEFMSFVSFF